MKHLIQMLIVISLSLGINAQEIPEMISYQGKLFDSNNDPVTGQMDFVFSIDSWTETHLNVDVNEGIYSVKLGSTNAIPISLFNNNSSLSLRIKVDGKNLSPNTDIISVPYAFKAEKAVDAAQINGTPVTGTPTTDQILKFDGTEWVPADPDTSGGGGGSDNWGNQVVKTDSTLSGDGTSGSKLGLASQSATTGEVLKWDGTSWAPGTDNMSSGGGQWTKSGSNIYFNTGNVGIGTSNPSFKLDLFSNSPAPMRINTSASYPQQLHIQYNSDPSKDWILSTLDNGDFSMQENGVSNDGRIIIQDATGYIGIGTQNPLHLLNVEGTESTSDEAVGHFKNNATNVNAAGVYGECKNTDYYGYGVYGEGGYIGVRGRVNTPSGTNTYIGVSGIAENSGLGATLYGVFGKENGGNSSSYGVFSFGNSGSTGTKSFVIDHPLDPTNMYLKHYSLESPEVLNLYRGTIKLDANGNAVISLPKYFKEINKNFSYHLTPIGGQALIYVVEEIKGNQFKIGGGTANMKVSWMVYGERNDLYIQKNPESAKVEIEKASHEKGKYAQPELYGAPKEEGIFAK